MTTRKCFLAVFPLLALAGPSRAETVPPPRALLRPAGEVVLAGLPPILASDVVKKSLMTGLTTTFALEVTARAGGGRRANGAAQVAVRYDLWEERYQITVRDASGLVRNARATSFEELRTWWLKSEVEVVCDPSFASAGPWRLTVSLQVLPFSHTEQLDAQRWLADSLREPPVETRTGEAGADGGPAPIRGLLSGLVATSVARRPVLTYRWDVPLDSSASP